MGGGKKTYEKRAGPGRLKKDETAVSYSTFVSDDRLRSADQTVTGQMTARWDIVDGERGVPTSRVSLRLNVARRGPAGSR